MRTICLYFEIHQIIHLKRYRFFDIGTNHYYYPHTFPIVRLIRRFFRQPMCISPRYPKD